MSRTLSALVAAAVLVAALMVAATAMGKPPVTLAGHVVGSDTHPVPGAEVDLKFRARTTKPFVAAGTVYADQSGAWEYTGRTGQYRLQISAPGADPVVLVVDAVAGQTALVEAELPSYGTIAGFVRGPDGVPVSGAIVEFYLQRADGSWPDAPGASVTAPDGAYTSPVLPSGLYRVRATAPGFVAGYLGEAGVPAVTDVDRGLAIADADIALRVAMGSITGHVYYPDGVTGFVNAFVWIYRQNPDGTWPVDPGYPTKYYRQVFTTAGGAYDSGPMPTGLYRIRFFSVHNGSQYWEYKLTPDAASTIEIAADGQVLSGVDCWFGHTVP